MSTRKLTDEEKRILRRRAKPFLSDMSHFKELCGYLISIGSTMSMVVFFSWLFLAWIVELVFDVDFGWNHPNKWAIFWVLIFLSMSYTAVAVMRTVRPESRDRDDLLKDIENGVVEIQEFDIREVKVLQEPEHGGLMYFLRTSDDQIYVTFDYESQNLGAKGEDPFRSEFVPKTKLRIEKTPFSCFPINTNFFGYLLVVPDPIELVVPPDKWPELEKFTNIKWTEIEMTYASHR